MSEWIKCSERMPPLGTPVIVAECSGPYGNQTPMIYGVTVANLQTNGYDPKGPYFKTIWYKGLEYIDDECHVSESICVSHWMPLPDPPISESVPSAQHHQ